LGGSDLSFDWTTKNLCELITIKHGYAFKGEYFSEEETTRILLTPGNFKIGGGFSDKKFKYFDDKQSFPEEFILNPGDLLITMTDLSKNGDTLGYPAIIPMIEGKQLLHNQRLGKVELISEQIDKMFLYYLLCTKSYRHHVLATATGSTVKHTSPKRILEYSFKIPELAEQRTIAMVLKILDDKIELNNAINKNLEEMAQALFKRWFIDFEFPNENGEPYKSSGGEFEESELGLIPKGWKVSCLNEIAVYLNGLAMQKYRPEGNEYIPVIKIKELNQGRTTIESDKASPNIDLKYIVNDGDVLFSWSGTLLVKLWCGGIGGLNQHLFKVSSDKYDKWFYYYWTMNYLDKFRNIASDKATTMGHIKRSDLKEAKVLIPDDKLYHQATRLFNPLIEKIIQLSIESRTLEIIRDTLLPKLMSGEIRVPVEEN
jgi:type I restriction enzyme S subunit